MHEAVFENLDKIQQLMDESSCLISKALKGLAMIIGIFIIYLKVETISI